MTDRPGEPAGAAVNGDDEQPCDECGHPNDWHNADGCVKGDCSIRRVTPPVDAQPVEPPKSPYRDADEHERQSMAGTHVFDTACYWCLRDYHDQAEEDAARAGDGLLREAVENLFRSIRAESKGRHGQTRLIVTKAAVSRLADAAATPVDAALAVEGSER